MNQTSKSTPPSSGVSSSRSWLLNLAGGVALALLLIFAYRDVVFLGHTFQTAAYEGVASTVTDMPWGYPGPRIYNDDIPVQDPASSAYNETVSPYAVNAAARRGELPLWNPHQACGTPLGAQPVNSAWYPPAWIMHLAPGAASWDLFLLLRLWLAGFFTFLFLRELRQSWAAALAGGAFFMLGGYLTRYVNLFHLNVVCLVPAAFWALERFRRRRSGLGGFLLYLFVCFMAVLGGNPQSHVMMAFGLVAWAAFAWAWDDGADCALDQRIVRVLKGAGIAAAGLALAVLLSAFFILPFLEYYRRAMHPHLPWMGLESLAIYQTITLLSPHFYFPIYLRWLNFPMMYMGVTVTFLCALAVPRERSRRAPALFLLVVITLLYCKITGFWFINWIGGLSFLKFMIFSKYSGLLHFFIAVTAAFGLNNLFTGKSHPRWTRIGVLLYVMAILALYARNLQKFKAEFNQMPILTEFLWVVLRFGCVLLLAVLAERWAGSKRRLWPAAALALFGLAELIGFMDGTRALRYDVFTPSPGIEKLHKERLEHHPWDRVYGTKFILFPQSATALGIQDARDFSVLTESRYWMFMKRFMNNTDIPTHLHPFFQIMFSGSIYQEVVFFPYFDMLGARYVLSDTYLNVPNFQEYFINKCEVWSSENNRDIWRGFRNDYFYIHMDSPMIADLKTTIPISGDTLLLDPVVDGKEFDTLSGGVLYSVEVEDNRGRRTRVFEHLENPHIDTADRILEMQSVSLDRWASQTVTLHFEVTGDIETGRPVKCLWRNLYLKSWEDRVRSNFSLIYDGEIKVYENRTAFPRAYVVPAAVLSPSIDESFKILYNQKFDPRDEVVLEYGNHDGGGAEALMNSGKFDLTTNESVSLRRFVLRPKSGAAGAGDYRAEILDYGMNSVEIEADMPTAGFLVLSDTFYPGWKAYVEGRETPVYCANYFLRGIALDEGRHRVTFKYRPASFYKGLAISLATLVFVIIGSIAIILRRKK